MHAVLQSESKGYTIAKAAKTSRAKRREVAETERIRTTIRVLVIEAALALDVFLVALVFGEDYSFGLLLGLLGIVAISILTLLILWKLKSDKRIHIIAKIAAILVAIPLSVLLVAVYPLIVASLYYLGAIFVLLCVAAGLAIWTANSIRELKARLGK